MKKVKIFCEICQIQTKYVIDNFSGYHLKKEHEGYDIKRYYDEYIRSVDEGICVMCNKVTTFRNFNFGYSKHCSSKCSSNNPERNKKISDSYTHRDNNEVQNKRKKTCLEKYGVDNVMKVKKFKKKQADVIMEKYGVRHNFLMDSCKERRKEGLSRPETNEKRKEWWADGSNKRGVSDNRKNTLMERYDVSNSLDIPEVRENIKKLFLEKFGKEYMVETEHFRAVMEDKHNWLPVTKRTEYQHYMRECIRIMNRHKKKLYSEWDKKCYYTGEILVGNEKYIQVNEDKHRNSNPLQPTIDHKESIHYGFLMGKTPEHVSSFDNLCICSRRINSSKNRRTEEQFLEWLNEK